MRVKTRLVEQLNTYYTLTVRLRDGDKQLFKLINDLKTRANVGHSFVVDVDRVDSTPGKFFIDGDGDFHIDDVSMAPLDK